MAGGAALVDEQTKACRFHLTQSRVISIEPGVKGRRRDQRRLISLDRLGEVVKAHRLRLFWERRSKPLHVLRHRVERRDHVARCIGHLDSRLHRPLGLLG